MRKYIYIIGALFIHIGLYAQYPIQTVFTVDLKTEQGKDSTIQIYAIDSNSFRFWGGKGAVTNPVTGETTQEENKDFYGWIENIDYYKATLKALPSSGLINSLYNLRDNFGYCISKQPNPVVSDSVISMRTYNADSWWYEGHRFYTCTFDLSQYIDLNTSYTLAFQNYNGMFSNEDMYFAQLEGLEYMTTYYVRPYIKLHGNDVMYGGEKSFTTPRTMEGALRNEKDLQDRNYCNWSTGVVLKSKALQTLLGSGFEPNDNVYRGISKELERYLTSDMLLQLKKQAYKEIECTDGTLYLIEDVPTDIVESFQKHLNSEIIFSPMGNVIDPDEQIAGSYQKVTKNLAGYEFIECDPAWNVPNNSYMYFQNTGTQNPSIGINIPQYVLPKTYDVYVVTVPVWTYWNETDNEGNILNTKAYRFYTYIWEQNSDGGYPNAGTRLSVNGTTISETPVPTKITNIADTTFVGSYTFNGTADPIIQIVTNITSSSRNIFSYNMCISQIILRPSNKEDNE